MSNINYLENLLKKINIPHNKDSLDKFEKFKDLLIEWNKKINITSIENEEEIYLKHFIDSVIIKKYVIIKEGSKTIDVGTGGGFPGIPLKLIDNEMKITLLDSLNKRIKFLDETVKELDLKDVECIHGRAEELGQDKKYREKYDYGFSRAVASLNVLLEYVLPFIKKDGLFIAFKGSNFNDEIQESKNALELLGGEIIDLKEYDLPESDISRSLIVIKKIKNTPNKYPRRPGTPNKKPL
ncbi:MAG: 16S rRNA (guanine(527)-N(7))-methyltransferase RsmG [Bacillota bacterium]|nr:16S rRNA (guanine(527)-N(7))-methyltransferase RsmG [Bacillota bacterium]